MLFVSSHFYALGRELGIARALRTINQQIDSPDRESLPAVRAIARLDQIEPVKLRLDTGATCIAKTRSRAFHDALAAEDCDVYFAIDDDCEATTPTLRWMIDAVRSSNGICLAPYVLRRASSEGPIRLSVDFAPLDWQNHVRELPDRGEVIRGMGGGFGLVAMHREALLGIAAANQAEAWDDDDGVTKLAIFREELVNRRWWGEDLAFFRRVPLAVRIEILTTGVTMHSGNSLDLGDLRALTYDVG